MSMNSFTRGGERKNNWMRFSMHLKSLSTDHATQPKNENVFSCCSEPMTFFFLWQSPKEETPLCSTEKGNTYRFGITCG